MVLSAEMEVTTLYSPMVSPGYVFTDTFTTSSGRDLVFKSHAYPDKNFWSS
ncbi:hypothetical protein PROFUN_13452 [Planoprotostelium fungivorum]|uniref:Uncharacterized protein n=1 Tax=Planoprotostelium fungivorum TaxID=1890364 RepID=A0A2P6N403_9EUKA|nr:hypothetical protein PROFUN_13452 [Planoprotostelium fungivorum]